MPTALEYFLEGSRPRRRKKKVAAPSLEEAAAKVDPRRPGFLENLFAWLDQPGGVVRNVLSGQGTKALENLGHFATLGLYDARDKKGSYAPDWGFWGNLLTDPMLFLTGGTAGAAKNITKAAAGVGARRFATRAAAKGLARSLTKEGLRHVDDLAGQLTGKTLARARKAALLKTVRRGGQIDDVLGKLKGGARAEDVLPGLKSTMLDQGGVKLGLPFMEGKTIGLAGKRVSLLDATPIPAALRAAGKVIRKHPAGFAALERGEKWLRDLGKKFYFGKNFSTEHGRNLASSRNAKIAMQDRASAERLGKMFDGFDEEALHDFTQTLSGLDVRGTGVTDAATFAAKHPKLAARYEEAYRGWTELMDETLERERALGLTGETPYEGIEKQAASIREGAGVAHARGSAKLERRVERAFQRAEKSRAAALEGAKRIQARAAALRKEVDDKVARLRLKEAELRHGRSPLELMMEGRPAVPGGIGPDVAAADQVLARAKAVREEGARRYRALERRAARAQKKAERAYDRTLKKLQAQEAGAKTELSKQQFRDTAPAARKELRIQDPVPRPYFPQQLTQEARDALELHNLQLEKAGLDDAFRLGTREPAAGASTTSSFLQERQFREQPDFLAYMREKLEQAKASGVPIPKDVQEQNILKLGMKRLQSHNRMVANAEMLRGAGKAQLVDRAFKEWVQEGAGALKRRKGVMAAVDLVNRKGFKPYVTIGLGVVPNPAFHVRNAIGGVVQAATHRDIGTAAGVRHLWEIVNGTIAKAVEKIPGMPHVGRTQLNRVLAGDVTDAVVKGTGRSEREVAQLLAEHGVTRQSFVRAENIVEELGPVLGGGKRSLGKKAYEAVLGTKFPGMVAEGIEDRMRANGFVAALRKGLEPEDAAQAVREAFLDYQVVSGAHRALRDVVPFAQFTIGQTPRTLRTAVESPRAIAPFREISRLGGESGPVPPFVAEQPHIPIGQDREGNAAHLVGLGTPFEDANKLWAGSAGRTIERGFGSLTPPFKAIYEEASGRDPFFGTERGSYRRDTPFAQLMPDVVAGRKKRTVKTPDGGTKEITEVSPGFLRALQYMPISRQISSFNQVFDQRKSVWQRSVSLLTGVKVVSVDQEKELKRLIGDYLRDKAKAGDVGQLQRFYAQGDVEPELAAIIKAYYAKGK